MNMLEIVVFLLFVTSVLCDDCVRYTFEENFEDIFDNTEAPCYGLSFWEEREYSSINIGSPHKNSARFVSPLETLSCVSSFPFPMTGGGTVEINVYMDSMFPTDTITVLASQIVVGGNNANVGTYFYAPSTSNYVTGWQTLRFTLINSGVSFDGYITIMGTQGLNSTVIVDSFRYIPPNVDEDSCILYEDESEITTLAPTTELDTEPPITLAPPTEPDTEPPTTLAPPTESDTEPPTSLAPTTEPDTEPLTTLAPPTEPDTEPPTTLAPTTEADTEPPTTLAPPTEPDTEPPTTLAPSTEPDTKPPTTLAPPTDPNTEPPTTLAPPTDPDTEPLTSLAPTTEDDREQTTTLAPTTEDDTEQTTTLALTTEADAEPPTTLARPTEHYTVPHTLAPTTQPDIEPPTTPASTMEPDTEPSCDTFAPTTEPELNTPTEAPIDIEFLENRCPVDPYVHWLLPHEDNCNLFYYCVWGEKVLRECPSELHFNPVIQVCDWPQSAGCAISINKHAETRRRLLL